MRVYRLLIAVSLLVLPCAVRAQCDEAAAPASPLTRALANLRSARPKGVAAKPAVTTKGRPVPTARATAARRAKPVVARAVARRTKPVARPKATHPTAAAGKPASRKSAGAKPSTPRKKTTGSCRPARDRGLPVANTSTGEILTEALDSPFLGLPQAPAVAATPMPASMPAAVSAATLAQGSLNSTVGLGTMPGTSRGIIVGAAVVALLWDFGDDAPGAAGGGGGGAGGSAAPAGDDQLRPGSYVPTTPLGDDVTEAEAPGDEPVGSDTTEADEQDEGTVPPYSGGPPSGGTPGGGPPGGYIPPGSTPPVGGTPWVPGGPFAPGPLPGLPYEPLPRDGNPPPVPGVVPEDPGPRVEQQPPEWPTAHVPEPATFVLLATGLAAAAGAAAVARRKR